MTDSAALHIVKRLLCDASGARDLLRKAIAAGFRPVSEDFLGLEMEGLGCKFIFSVLASKNKRTIWTLFRRPDRIWSLVFKEGDERTQTLVREGELTFTMPKTSGDTVSELHGDAAWFFERLCEHRSRMLTAGPEQAAFLRNYLTDKIVASLATFASEKMALTQVNGDEQSIMIPRAPVCYTLCTLPVSLSNAARWFGDTHGGYGNVLEHCWNSDTFRAAQCEVLCHVTHGRIEHVAWTNVSIFPIRSSKFSFPPVLAIDLLSPAERTRVGALGAA